MKHAVIASLLLLSLSQSAESALLHPAETLPPLVDSRQFQSTLDELRSLVRGKADVAQSSVPARQAAYKQRLAALQAKPVGDLTVEDRVNLSAYMLRLMTEFDSNWIESALEVLLAIPAQDRDFQAWANLASAYHARAQSIGGRDSVRWLETAKECAQAALKAWPREHARYTPWELLWFQRCERLYVDLLAARLVEAQRGAPSDQLLPDALFPGAKFCQPGPYKIGWADDPALPSDALLAVRQLVVWLPMDDRLYWQLAELINTQEGDFLTAQKLFDELLDRRKFGATELSQRYRQLNRTKQRVTPLQDAPLEVMKEQLRKFHPTQIDSVEPKWSPVTPLSNLVTTPGTDPDASPSPEEAKAKAIERAQRVLQIQRYIVSFLAGGMIALILAAQWRRWRGPAKGAGMP